MPLLVQTTGRDVLGPFIQVLSGVTTKNCHVRRGRLKQKKKSHAIPIKGLIPGMAVHFAGCCHPLPGDRIVGIVTTGKGVTIHTIDCETLEAFQEAPERWIDVAWGGSSDGSSTPHGYTFINTPGSLGTLSTVIGRDGGNISNLKVTNRSVDFFELLVDIEVMDVKQLTDIIALRASSVIHAVERQRG